jgi:hypothetical protein
MTKQEKKIRKQKRERKQDWEIGNKRKENEDERKGLIHEGKIIWKMMNNND